VNGVLDRKEDIEILDVGGTIDFWRSVPELYGHPRVKISVVNIDGEERDEGNLSQRFGNACKLPYPDLRFDIVHSNSVIEHVGHWEDVSRMASEVRRLAGNYFVQTPNMWFPIEPHFKLPLVHWLPEQTRMTVLSRLGRVPADPAGAAFAVQRISLLSSTQMQYLFPDATLWKERFLGLTKSIVAIKAEGNLL
jgi:hypothetical protein